MTVCSTATAICWPTTSTASTTASHPRLPRVRRPPPVGRRARTTSASSPWTSNASGAADLRGRFLDWYREFSAETHPGIARTPLRRLSGTRAGSKISCLRGSPDDLDAGAGAHLVAVPPPPARRTGPARHRRRAARHRARPHCDGLGDELRLARAALRRAPQAESRTRLRAIVQRLRTKKVSTSPLGHATPPTPRSSTRRSSCSRTDSPSSSTRRSPRATWRAAARDGRDRQLRLGSWKCCAPSPPTSPLSACANGPQPERTPPTPTPASRARWGATSTSGRLPPTSTLDSHGQSWRHGCESWSSPDATDGLATRWKRARQRQVDVTLG